ncbi:MAG: sugar-transfer associated ATP-grasp domain-containing protein [Alphaproteobacteria bacterium]
MDNSQKYFWFVGGGVEAVPALIHAKKQGHRIIVSDGNVAAPGMVIADIAIQASTYDHQASLEAALEYRQAGGRVDGILSVGVDVPLSVAHLAQGLGLAGNSIESARASMDKLHMKDMLSQAGIPVPAYQAIDMNMPLQDIKAFSNHHPDFILKPVDSRGARGVSKLDKSDDDETLNAAFQRAIAASPSQRVMIEAYLAGPQYSTEGLLIDGNPHPIIIVNRNYSRLAEFAPFIIEDGGSFPPDCDQQTAHHIEFMALKAGAALGAVTSAVKGDMVLTADGPKVIEVALRPSGGYLATHQIPHGVGVDFINILLLLAQGKRPTKDQITPYFKQALAIRYFFAPKADSDSKTLQQINNLNKWHANPDVIFLKLPAQIGSSLSFADNHTARLGCVLVRSKDEQTAAMLADQIIKDVEFV